MLTRVINKSSFFMGALFSVLLLNFNSLEAREARDLTRSSVHQPLKGSSSIPSARGKKQYTSINFGPGPSDIVAPPHTKKTRKSIIPYANRKNS